MSSDRLLREDATIVKMVEKILKSDVLLDKICKIIGEKTANIIKAYEEKVVSLEAKLEKAYENVDGLEQYSRRNSLRIYGVPETAKEDIDAVITSVCKEKLAVDVSTGSIDLL